MRAQAAEAVAEKRISVAKVDAELVTAKPEILVPTVPEAEVRRTEVLVQVRTIDTEAVVPVLPDEHGILPPAPLVQEILTVLAVQNQPEATVPILELANELPVGTFNEASPAEYTPYVELPVYFETPDEITVETEEAKEAEPYEYTDSTAETLPLDMPVTTESETEIIPVAAIDSVPTQPEAPISPTVSESYVTQLVELTHFSNLLPAPVSLPTEAVNILHEAKYELPVLPTVCLEITSAIEQLDTEPAAYAHELIGKITETIAAIALSRESGDDQARAQEEMLEQLCLDLFEYVGVEYTRETVFDFVMGVVQAQKATTEIAVILQEKDDEGTHELKQDDVQNIGQLAQILQYPLTRTLGTLILRLSHSAAFSFK